ncbi:MAG: DUF2789 domain-containing protein [Pseudomonadota bacterium]
MEEFVHNMNSLFAQLGLPADTASIDAFIASHGPLDSGTILSEAPFWTPGQAAFLKEEILLDAAWAPVIDELNTALHAQS